MRIIYCGEENRTPYYIREADINIYSLQELAYFIMKYPMLIGNSFINKSLLLFIKNHLNNANLYDELANAYSDNKKDIVDLLLLIIDYSGMYDDEDVNKFLDYIRYLKSIDKDEYLKISADSLYRLKKYHKAILQYQKIPDNIYSYRCIGYAYAKLLNFKKAIEYLEVAYSKENKLEILENLYICCKLNKNINVFDKYRDLVTDEEVAEWEYNLVRLQLNAKNSKNVSATDDIFLMGDNYIKENINFLISEIKEKYRYV